MQKHNDTLAPILRLDGLTRIFRQGEREIRVLDGASAQLMPGQAVALVGPSGAGKSTLLHVAGLLETPDAGHVVVNGRDCSRTNDDDRTRVVAHFAPIVLGHHTAARAILDQQRAGPAVSHQVAAALRKFGFERSQQHVAGAALPVQAGAIPPRRR